MKFIKILLLLSLLILNAEAKKSKSDEIDHLALAALMLKDGHTARAADELAQADQNVTEFDFIRYYTLNALVLTKQSSYKVANENFSLSIKAGQTDKSVYMYMAQNSFKLENYKETISSIDKAGELALTKEAMYALKAESYKRLDDYNSALVTLKAGIKTFPKHWKFYKQRFGYYLHLHLYQSSLEDAEVYLQNAKVDAKTSIAFISALRKSGATEKATALAEEANIMFSDEAKVTVLLAHLYIDQEKFYAAAHLFDEASRKDTTYTKEAAEMLRRAKEFSLALYKNAQLLETKEKYKQRIAIYLEFGDYEKIVATEDAMERAHLLEDENMRYALAYAFYKVNDFNNAERHLQLITQSALFVKAIEIRKNMEKCQNNIWECE